MKTVIEIAIDGVGKFNVKSQLDPVKTESLLHDCYLTFVRGNESSRTIQRMEGLGSSIINPHTNKLVMKVRRKDETKDKGS